MKGDDTLTPIEDAPAASSRPVLPPPPPELPDEDELNYPASMSRRKVVVLASALALLGLGLLLTLVVVLGTQTSYGREYIRQIVLDLTKGAKGKVYIGHIGGNLFTGVTIDSLELRDDEDSLFVATGPVSVTYDPRDFVDRRVLLRHVRVERPLVVLRKHEDGMWNYRRLFPQGKPKAKRRERGFGDFIAIDSADVVDGRFVLTLPWHPADSLTGARRDSAIRANLHQQATCDAVKCWSEMRRDAEGYKRTWRWSGGDVSLSQARLADPDSAARVFRIARLAVEEADPPFAFRNVRGEVRMLKDTAWIDLPHFDLPGSTGRAQGRVVWGDSIVQRFGAGPQAPVVKQCRELDGDIVRVRSANERLGGCPVRYDLHVWGDSVSLADVAWVYPTLPRAGGGRMELHIGTDPADVNVIDYALTKMDVRSMGSRLRGRMTYGVGGPVLVVKDVAVDAEPMDFRLIRQLNGKDFPYPWAGTITGRVVGRGGPLNRFRVDSARFTFRDANVPGATTIGSARGELDILFPAYTAFHGLAVTVDQLDLRTLQFLNPNFPRVNGFVAGKATLDSSWLDVRFRDAEMAHFDGPGEPSRATGRGRVTWGEQFMTWDLDLDAQPLSLTTLARSYPTLPARGSFRGPIRVQGTAEDLQLRADLTGAAGRLTVDGTFDTYPPGFAARATGRVEALDPRLLLERADIPDGTITAGFTTDVRGDTITDLAGTLALAIERSLLGGVRIYGGTTRLAFTPGHVRIDTLAVETAAANVTAAGGLGLAPSVRDSVRFVLVADSLGGLRRWLLPARDGVASVDTLGGTLRVEGTLAGSLDTLGVRAVLDGDALRVATSSVQRLSGVADLRDVTRVPHGRVALRADTALVGGITVLRTSLGLDVVDAARTRYELAVDTRNGVRLTSAGEAVVSADTTRLRLDSLALDAGADQWRMERAAMVTAWPTGVALDELAVTGSRGGHVVASASLPAQGAVMGSFRATGVPLATFGQLIQATSPYGGRLTATAELSGTRQAPIVTLDGVLDSASFGGVSLQRVTAGWSYAGRAARGTVALYRGGQPVLTATGTLPIDLAMRPMARRLVDDAPLAVNVRSEAVDLGLVESFSPVLRQATGSFEANVDVGGSWRRPVVTGRASVTDGAVTMTSLGVRLRAITTLLRFQGDTLAIDRLSAETVGDNVGRVQVSGGINFADFREPTFDITMAARNFLAIRRPRVAELELSTVGGRPLHLVGSVRGARLTGGLEVTRGSIFIPEFTQKNVVSLDDPEFYRLVDTSLFTNRTLLPSAPPELVRNLTIDNVQVRMGDDVWLRSAEASINLGGAVRVTSGRDPRYQDKVQLALVGELSAVRGTYRFVKTFTVERGSLKFSGDPDLNPTLNIWALYTVRQSDQSRTDVPIRIKIGGTLAQPTLTLESADNIQRDQSDLLSYLVTGQPNLESAFVGGNTFTTAANLGVEWASTFLTGKQTWFDMLTLQSGRTSARTASGLFDTKNVGGVFANTRVAAGQQLTDKLWLNFSYGLCSAGNIFNRNDNRASSGRRNNELENVGARLEYRLSRTWSVTGSSEPSTSSLVCNQTGSGTVLTTPRQWGLDFSKKWEF